MASDIRVVSGTPAVTPSSAVSAAVSIPAPSALVTPNPPSKTLIDDAANPSLVAGLKRPAAAGNLGGLATPGVSEDIWVGLIATATLRLDNQMSQRGSLPYRAWLREGQVDPVLSRDTNVAMHGVPGQFLVRGVGADGVLKLRGAFPVSSHALGEDRNGKPSYQAYARNDRAIVWVAYIDRNGRMPGDPVTVPAELMKTPTTSAANVKILARDVAAQIRPERRDFVASGGVAQCDKPSTTESECDTHFPMRWIDVDVPMTLDKIAVVMFDSNSQEPGATVDGFVEGRAKLFYLDDKGVVARAPALPWAAASNWPDEVTSDHLVGQ